MNTFNPDWIGSIGATLTTVAFIPQVWKIWRSKSARDISLPMYACFTTGLFAWLAYGALLQSWPIIVANLVTLVLAGAVVVMKLKWG
jgi:MtN3 and saliva related transmembrane protein